METQQQLFSLMAVAEDHQKAVKAAIDGLTAERAALAKDRAAVVQAVASVAGVANEVRKAAKEAVAASVAQSLTGASEVAANALREASKPIVGQLSGVVRAACEAEGKLAGAVASFGWKWAVMAGSAAAGAVIAVVVVAWGAVWWQRYQVEQLAEQKAALQSDVADLQVSVTKLEQRGGRIVMSTCGGRLCIEANTNQGNGMRNWHGPWKSDNGTQLVIPKRY